MLLALLGALPLTLESGRCRSSFGALIARGRDLDAGQRLEPLELPRAPMSACFAARRCSSKSSSSTMASRRFPAVRAQHLLAVPARRLQVRRAFARRSTPPPIRARFSAARCRRAARPGRGGARLRHVRPAAVPPRSSSRSRCVRRCRPIRPKMISMIKATALVSLVTLWDMMSVALKIRNDTLVTYSAAARRRRDLFRHQLHHRRRRSSALEHRLSPHLRAGRA